MEKIVFRNKIYLGKFCS